MQGLAERYTAVRQRIQHASKRAGRDPAEITLVAVTKTWPAQVILDAYEAGMRHFGENRAEELAEKRPFLEKQLGTDSGIVWHAIGNLQSRKAKIIADQADLFHALDRLKIGNKVSAQLKVNGRQLPVFLEVNVSGESTKSGFICDNWEKDATQTAALRNVAQQINALPGLIVVGLMTMAPWGAPEAEIRSVFRRTTRLARTLQADIETAVPLQLSMGMTDDFEIAIEEGATHVRVGRAIFGDRQ